jgi:AcrR family transcriptional regulator
VIAITDIFWREALFCRRRDEAAVSHNRPPGISGEGVSERVAKGRGPEAGFTLGAFYRHFPNKEALFEALVKEDADGLLQRYTSAHQTFASLPPDEQIADMASVAGGGFGEMIGYMLDRFDSFKLIFCRSEGTAYARFLDGLIEGECRRRTRFIDTLNRNGHPVPDIDYALVHILATAIFRGVVEISNTICP